MRATGSMKERLALFCSGRPDAMAIGSCSNCSSLSACMGSCDTRRGAGEQREGISICMRVGDSSCDRSRDPMGIESQSGVDFVAYIQMVVSAVLGLTSVVWWL